MLNETPLYFGDDEEQLFGVLHIPVKNNLNCGFVFCHPFAEEKLWAHRVYVSFARTLVEMGYTVLRFDHRGYGDSDGAFSELNVQTYISDIKVAISYLHNSQQNLESVGLFGYRLGASFALNVSQQQVVSGPVILWDPIIDGDRYMQEFLRSHLSTQLAVYGEVKENREQLVENMNKGEYVNVEGYDLAINQFNSISAVNLKNTTINKGRFLIVQVGRTEKPKKQSVDLSESINAQLECVVEEPFWREIKQFYYQANNLSTAAVNWLGSEK